MRRDARRSTLFRWLPRPGGLVALTCVWLLAACAFHNNALQPLPDPDVTNYRLGAGDQIRVITYDDTQLSNDFTVGADGTIAFPLLGTLQASGLTIRELEDQIADGLKTDKLLSEPSVSVQVVQYRPISVLGEVNRPGQYPYQPGMTMLDAVALAGGFTYRAVTGSALDWRSGDQSTGQPVEGIVGPGSNLAPGDVITIHERYF
jgi:polysaccharide export outer membrane protein